MHRLQLWIKRHVNICWFSFGEECREACFLEFLGAQNCWRWRKESSSTAIRWLSLSHSELIEEVMNDLQMYAAHLFRAKWQQMQFYKVMMKQPPESSAVMVMDFAENFVCLNQNDVKSAPLVSDASNYSSHGVLLQMY